ncbi:putative caffeine-induced death protein 1 protein [Phaeoacremonium minimum UCRPA7]|uniref:Putative caffeine-induced death protein 1 protein n=1 Tax=Phaeoacremonium minimum (strain UCR-PA7) TaxID=1286976 RepID=R8BWS7_PHAM7|nr:putative caffeine-induced death protein 1 protein [Phaeoacremonium minimum UCRPA7]EOO03754.1 putative caffeine-induced death protein 1 protein [Phaeoacremonium minimum UCRPA7]
MDLGLISPLSIPQPDSNDSAIPRVIEKAFLDVGLGARLLTRTRVPIIKLCEKPPEKLLHDLREERLKWEKGLDDDAAAEEEDRHEDVTDGLTRQTDPADSNNAGHSSKLSDAGGLPGSEKYQQSLDNFKQGANVHLLGYYNMAKRLLRKLGGRDISHSTAADFSAEDFKILNDVCHAFLRGLADDALRTSLESYVSLTFERSPSTNMPSNRSLAGVFTQMEGERLALMWECRHIHEKDDHQEGLAQKRIDFWKDVQNKLTFGLDPLAYNRELQLAADQLKRIPSIELMLLEQAQYETASQYHSRAIKLMLDLGGHDSASPSNEILSAVIRHYIAGISHEDIREQVTAFAESLGNLSLKAVARRHKSLQLAKEFDKALEKDLYAEEDATAIKAYLPLLRSPMKPTDKMGEYFDFVIPVTAELSHLLAKINTLSDPAKLAPNQPRDPYKDRLEFPKSGVGVQCDINFSAHLALHNTLLLRCYSHTDPRVRPLVLFVKHWAKVRGINTPYRGTLSSYGYVLMMLHYLVNVAQPFVCPNLQAIAPPPDPNLPPEIVEETMVCKGRNVQFWRDEDAIKNLARQGSLTQNQDSIGYLIRGFFEYFAQSNMMSTIQIRGFDWGRDVLSIRTHGGLLSKQEKGWTGAKTVFEVQNKGAPPPASEPHLMQANPQTPIESSTPTPTTTPSQPLPSPGEPPKSSHDKSKGGEVKEIRHRYLFAIEDPFELDHNVARTVTHNGIVAIRDEFRRAWRIIRNAGRNVVPEDLLEDVTADKKRERDSFSELLVEIHGNKLFDE